MGIIFQRPEGKDLQAYLQQITKFVIKFGVGASLSYNPFFAEWLWAQLIEREFITEDEAQKAERIIT